MANEESKPKYQRLDREQGVFTTLHVDHLIGPEHPARAIWDLAGRLDLSGFENGIESREAGSGRPCWPPRLLISIWVYGYSQGIGSARELERRMEWEPGLRWLCALEVVNHHTLSDFRMSEPARLEQLLASLLSLLSSERLVDFSLVLQDGTKIQTRAGRQSWRSRSTLEQQREQARQYVAELDLRAAAAERTRGKKEAAQQRAARERLERMESALAEMSRREQRTHPGARTLVSESEPEAVKMKHPHGGWEPSYNLQLVTEAKNGFIAGVGLTTDRNDLHQIVPAVQRLPEPPQRIVADNGYASRDNVERLAAMGVELVAPWKSAESREAGGLASHGTDPRFAPSKFIEEPSGETLRCPAGQSLAPIGVRHHHGRPVIRYQAASGVCACCDWQQQCCPNQARRGRRVERVVESEPMRAYQERMAQPEAQALYRTRAQRAEFPNLWIKGYWKIRRFSVRGLARASKEALWLALSFNVQQWIRLQRPAGSPA